MGKSIYVIFFIEVGNNRPFATRDMNVKFIPRLNIE